MKLPKLKRITTKLIRETMSTVPRVSSASDTSKISLPSVATFDRKVDFDQIIEKFKDKLIRAGVDVSVKPKKLGSGALGSAFFLPASRKVLKITKDLSEANAAMRIKGKHLRNVYDIYDVYELENTKTYAIHQELLAPLDQDLYREWEYIQDALADIHSGVLYNRVIKKLSEKIPDFNKTNKYKDALDQAYNGLGELESNGIKFYDYHRNNVLTKVNSREIAFIDLGISRSPKVPIEKIEERLLRDIFKHHMERIA